MTIIVFIAMEQFISAVLLNFDVFKRCLQADLCVATFCSLVSLYVFFSQFHKKTIFYQNNHHCLLKSV